MAASGELEVVSAEHKVCTWRAVGESMSSGDLTLVRAYIESMPKSVAC